MAKPTHIALSLSLSAVVTTASPVEVHRWVDEQGRVHFSDRRPYGIQTESLFIDPGAAPAARSGPESEDPESDTLSASPYELFRILVPTPGAVLDQLTDTLLVSLLVNPPLLENHRVSVILNGTPSDLTDSSSQWQASGIGFGPHVLRAQIRDETGRILAMTPVHEFTLQQALPQDVLP